MERNSLHLLSASVFPLQAPQPISQAPQQRHWRPPGSTAVRTPTRRWFSKGNKGQLAGQPGQCGTMLLTQETELLFFFPLKTNKKIYISIFIFSCRVAPEQVCIVTQSVDSPNLKLRIEARQLPVGWGSAGGTRRAESRAGPGTLLQAAHSYWEASIRQPSPTSRDPHHHLFGARNLRGGGLHRTQTFKEQEKRTLVLPPPTPLQPNSGP